ncbi:MAG: hypothetical protein ACREER_03635 [Alphaproteobacteria bacterium]
MNAWLWLALAVLGGGGAFFFAALGVSAGSAYGANYHSLTERQRWMGATLYRGSFALSIGSGAMAALALLLAIRQWLG